MKTKYKNLQDAIEILMFDNTLKIFILLLLTYEFHEDNSIDHIAECLFSESNKHKILVNMKLMKNFKLEQIIYVIIHEILHIILLHGNRLEGFNDIITGLATDHVINNNINHDIDKLILNHVSPPTDKYKPFIIKELVDENMSCEDVAKYLQNNMIIHSISLINNKNLSMTIDEFTDYFKNSIKNESVEVTYSINDNKKYKTIIPIYNNKNENSLADRASQELIENFKIFKKDIELKFKERGLKTGKCFDLVKNEIKVIIPFTDILRKIFKNSLIPDPNKLTWSRINKRKKYGQFYAPGTLRKEEYNNLLGCIDTSGSMSRHDFALVNGVLREFFEYYSNMTILYHDTKITNIVKPSHPDDINLKKFKGRGGTSHTAVYDYIKKHESDISTIFLITDYYSNLDTIHTPKKYSWINDKVIILIISKNGKKSIKAKFSKIIYAEDIIIE